ncbi:MULTISPECIES: hypothetical protein [Oceanimonas]|uniref:hypothetical protein n=1 Tax=Oceanimonas TaxID=129577 RepID=UPI0029357550|nr:hypothetical protein [Oceanimonas sp. CAM02]MDV2858503.1 hypothetical protein [Oceanimonas sp. CAM02]
MPAAEFERIHAWLGQRPEVQTILTTARAETELLEVTAGTGAGGPLASAVA